MKNTIMEDKLKFPILRIELDALLQEGGDELYEYLQEHFNKEVGDGNMNNNGWSYIPPTTKEAYYYRKLFCNLFGEHRQQVIPSYWQPKWSSDGSVVKEYMDPSARVLPVYQH